MSPLTGRDSPRCFPNKKAQVTAVMIENKLMLDRKVVLTDTDMVYETCHAEGGITRFMALYQESTSVYWSS